jgi:uncharacterized membrane protein
MSMRAKKILGLLLLVYVVFSLFMVVVRNRPHKLAEQSKELTLANSGLEESELPQGAKDIVIVYYFHGYRRCYSCLEAERVARETVQRYFKGEISKGRLRFLSINVEEPENEHFIRDYQITSQTLVVAKFVDGKQVESCRVDEIWMFPSAEDRANIIRQVVSDFLSK